MALGQCELKFHLFSTLGNQTFLKIFLFKMQQSISLLENVQLQKISKPTPQRPRSLDIPRGWGFQMPNFVKESTKLNWWEVEGVGIFSGTTQSQSYPASYPKLFKCMKETSSAILKLLIT